MAAKPKDDKAAESVPTEPAPESGGPAEGAKPGITAPPPQVRPEAVVMEQPVLRSIVTRRPERRFVVGKKLRRSSYLNPREAADGNQMVDSYYLILAGRQRRTVARLVGANNPSVAIGSGFLVGPCLLMTCYHTIRSARSARLYSAQFDYLDVWDGMDEKRRSDLHRLRPDVFFHSNRELDYAITFVEPWSDIRKDQTEPSSLLRRRWNQLRTQRWSYEARRTEQWVNIIQHPHGGLQKVALRDSQARPVRGRKPHHLHYLADTNPKSSGSPVWNDRWELVGLHHQAIPNRRRHWRRRGKWLANQGVRTSEIAKSLDAFIRRGRQLDGLGSKTTTLDDNVKTLLKGCFVPREPDPDKWKNQSAKLKKARDALAPKPKKET